MNEILQNTIPEVILIYIESSTAINCNKVVVEKGYESDRGTILLHFKLKMKLHSTYISSSNLLLICSLTVI